MMMMMMNTSPAPEGTDSTHTYLAAEDRATLSLASHLQNIIQRDALPTMAWEGLTILESGIIYAGDELRPGTAEPDANGGSIRLYIIVMRMNHR